MILLIENLFALHTSHKEILIMKKPKLSALTLREKIGQTAIVHTDLPGFQDLKNHPYGSIWACGDLEFGVDISKAYAADTKRDTWLGTIKGVNRELKIPLLQATDCACTIAAKEYGYVLDHTTIGATGNIDFAELKVVLSEAVMEGETVVKEELAIRYGVFLDALLNFLLIAVCVFAVIKVINTIKEKAEKLKKKEEEEAKAAAPAPAPDPQLVLLEEIRDLLKDKK